MSIVSASGETEFWSADIPVPTHKICYCFQAFGKDEEECWFGPKGIHSSQAMAGHFRTGYRFSEDILPSWTGKSVWYQIFPERFRGGNEKAGFTPQTDNFWGGTLKGIQEKIPYLKDLGVTGVYLNPVFKSPSNHRYDTVDYLRVDERLGGNEALISLAEELHRNGMKVMMDGVFNHCSDQHPYFQDVKEKGAASLYRDWFIVHDLPTMKRVPVKELPAERMKNNPPYECFAFAANMPKWNTEHPAVQEYLIGAAEYWTKTLGVDAWRLDVPDEVSPSFLRAFRGRIKRISPEILILGEIWTDPDPWTQGGLFDGTMDYPLYEAVIRFMITEEIDAYTFCDLINRRMGMMTGEMMKNQMIFLGNHDLPRVLTVAKGNMDKVKAAWTFLCLMEGELVLYYGDENAMEGGEDPANRGAMRWEETEVGREMQSFIRDTIQKRQRILAEPLRSMQCEALSASSIRVCFHRGKQTCSFFFTLDPSGFDHGQSCFKISYH